MQTITRLTAIALAATAALGAGQASATVVNVSAASGAGTTVALGAGTYSLQFIDDTYSGWANYDAWNAWSQVTGCDSAGMNCTRGYRISLAIDFGQGVDNFDRTDGLSYVAYSVPGNNHIYATGAQALANIATDNLKVAPLDEVFNYLSYTSAAYPIIFTVGANQNVNFFIRDINYADNTGGVSLLIAAVPEPATWAMMIVGFGIVGGALRRRKTAARIRFA